MRRAILAFLLAAVTASGSGCLAAFSHGAGGDWPLYNLDLENSRATTAEDAFTPQAVRKMVKAWEVKLDEAITSTPVVADGLVYVGTWNGTIYAVDRHGRVAWETPVGAQVDSSGAIYDGTVYFGDALGYLHALDAKTGEPRWRVLTSEFNRTHLWGSPIVANGTLLMGVSSDQEEMESPDFRGSLLALDPRTGQERWRAWLANPPETGAPLWSTPAVDVSTGSVYFGTGNSYAHPDAVLSDAIVSVSLADGQVRWARQMTENDIYTLHVQHGPDWDFGASANLVTIDGRRLVGEGQKSGVYHLLDAATGDVVWQSQEPSEEASIIGSAAVWNDIAVVPYALGHEVKGLSLREQRVLWSYSTGASVFAPVSIAQGIAFVGTASGNMTAIDVETGAEIWKTRLPGMIYGGASISRGQLLFGSMDGTLYAFEPGRSWWE